MKTIKSEVMKYSNGFHRLTVEWCKRWDGLNIVRVFGDDHNIHSKNCEQQFLNDSEALLAYNSTVKELRI